MYEVDINVCNQIVCILYKRINSYVKCFYTTYIFIIIFGYRFKAAVYVWTYL